MFSLGKVPLQVRGRSGFNKDHRFCATPAVGNLIPVLTDPVIPGTRVSIKGALKAQLFPLATDAFANLDYRLEGFFVPYRVLYGGFEFAVTGKYIDSGSSTDEPSPEMIGTRYKAAMPRLVVHYNDSSERNKMGAGSLSDYLGYKTGKTPSPAGVTNTRYFNIMPFLAYHMIYDQYYRNPIVQKSVFAPANAYESRDLSTLPYRSIAVNAATANAMGDVSGLFQIDEWFRDGVSLGALRQRNFDDDYFTSARRSPQFGDAPTIGFQVDASTHKGELTLASIRTINALTQFCERHGIAGPDFDRWVAANYDVHPTATNKVVFLGHDNVQVYSDPVEQTAQNTTESIYATNNPFESVGAKYGDAKASGQFHICDDFLVTEPGIIMVIASLVPKPLYATGIRRYLRHFDEPGWIADIANPILESVGPQVVYVEELDTEYVRANPTDLDEPFGYQDRYAEFKVMNDESHGLFRPGETMEAFALQRAFLNTGPRLNSNFIRIPSTFLRDIMAVTDPGMISQLGMNGVDDRGNSLSSDHTLDMWFDYKASMPLSRYSIPSLVTSADNGGATVVLPRK